MKSKFYGALAVLAAALIVSVPFVAAQSRVQADVPFAFSLQDHSMPAGNYQIIAGGRVLEVRNLDTRQSQLLLQQLAVQASDVPSPKLVFHKYGNQYFLSQIWFGQSSYGIALGESKQEKEVKTAANVSNAPETVIVAMK